jgi:hypothetical protein
MDHATVLPLHVDENLKALKNDVKGKVSVAVSSGMRVNITKVTS